MPNIVMCACAVVMHIMCMIALSTYAKENEILATCGAQDLTEDAMAMDIAFYFSHIHHTARYIHARSVIIYAAKLSVSPNFLFDGISRYMEFHDP